MINIMLLSANITLHHVLHNCCTFPKHNNTFPTLLPSINHTCHHHNPIAYIPSIDSDFIFGDSGVPEKTKT